VVLLISLVAASWRGGADDQGSSPALGHNASAPATPQPSERTRVASPAQLGSTPPAARLPAAPDAPSPPAAGPLAPCAGTAPASETARKPRPVMRLSESPRFGTSPVRERALPDDAVLEKRK
jgi:hypothetical protein